MARTAQVGDIPLDVLQDIVARVYGAAVVEYSPRDGVICQVCERQLRPGENMGIKRTMPWIGDNRERFHRCPHCGARFKSVEELR